MDDLIVVTGALGNIGSAVVGSLLDAGARVRVADIVDGPLEERFPAAESAVLDFTDPATFEAVVEDADRVFLVRPPAIARVGPTLNAFLDVAEATGVEHVVFSSVAGAEDNRIVPHHRVEQHLFDTGMAWTVLRPGFFTQNIGTAYRRDIADDDRIVLPAGDGLVAFVDTRDIGEVAALALSSDDHLFEAHHLTGSEAMTFHEVAAIVSDVLGRTITYEPSTVGGYFRHLREQGLEVAQATVQTVLHAGLRRGDAEAVTDEVEQLLGRPPRTVRAYVEEHAHLWS